MLKPKQLKAIEILVAGGNEEFAASVAGVTRITLWRWKFQPEFAMELQNRTATEMEATRRVAGAEIRARVNLSMLSTQKMTAILGNSEAPLWMQFQAAQAGMKNGRWASEKVDPEFRRTETIGEVDDEHRCAAEECTRKVAVWQNKDRFLAELQAFEDRRVQDRTRQREAETLRRLNILKPLNAQDQRYMIEYWRRDDDHDVSMEETRRAKARKDFAAAAGVELNELPPEAPLKWADLKDQFKNYILPADEPATPAEAEAQLERAKKLSYPDPNSPAEIERRKKFEENLKATEADYKANVMPQVQSPIEREVASVPIVAKVPNVPTVHKGRRKRWKGPIPDRDSPNHQAYLDSLPDNAVPELSVADRLHKEDWDRRRARSEANERSA